MLTKYNEPMKAQTKTWILLLVVLAAFGAYALGAAQWGGAGGLLRKIDLTTLRDTAREHDTGRAAAQRTATSAPARPAAKDTARQRILFIGDSMLEGLSRRLADYAAANGHELHTVIWYSSSSKAWAECDTLEHFAREFRPTLVMVCLGANELFVKDLPLRRGYVERVVKKAGNVPLVWIGPPCWKADTGINDIIRETVGAGRFFDSSRLHLTRRKDGAHPTPAAAAAWMDSVAAWMSGAEAAHPVRMDVPKSHVQPSGVTILQPYRG